MHLLAIFSLSMALMDAPEIMLQPKSTLQNLLQDMNNSENKSSPHL